MARVTRIKVRQKIAQTWPDADPAEILAVLDAYGTEEGESGRARVQLAILKVCEGDRERLPELVAMAKRDYRDVLAYAEYPEELRTGWVEMRKMSREEVKALRARDRAQYLAWLGG
jgi:hypothetical protein